VKGNLRRAVGHVKEARAREVALALAQHRAARATRNGRTPLPVLEDLWRAETGVRAEWQRAAAYAVGWLLS
jgi:hypothetical protein